MGFSIGNLKAHSALIENETSLLREHVQSLTTVYETDDYALFKKLEQNRAVVESRVKKLIASLHEKAIDIPVIVNEKMEIIDGQGRYEARKSMGLKIPFIVISGLDIEDCRRLNRYNSNWSSADWINSWSKCSDPVVRENYKRFQECAERNNIAYSIVSVVSGKSGNYRGGKGGTIFESGALKFTEADSEFVDKALGHGNEIIDALCFTQRINSTFWAAIRVILRTDGYSNSRMIKNCKLCRERYAQMSSLGSQLAEFSRIYNYRTKSANKIFFEDYMRNKGANVREYSGTYHDYTDVSTLD